MGRPGPKKKARMSRTRSDFLTRCNSEGATQSDDDDEYYIPVHSRTLPPSPPSLNAHPEADCHSDPDMVKHWISAGPPTSERSTVSCLLGAPSFRRCSLPLRGRRPRRQGEEPLTPLTLIFALLSTAV